MNDQTAAPNELYKSIYSFVRKRVSHQEDVADLVQGIFLKFQENQSKLRDKSLLIPWLYKIARNQIIDYYRKNKAVAPEMPESLDESGDEVFLEVSTWLHFFISLLNIKDQEILKLVELDGKTQKQAAEILKISPDAAKARHQRAKRRLREKLEKCCEYSFDSKGKIIDYKIKGNEDCC